MVRQMVEFSKYLTVDDVWPDALLDKNPELKGQTLYEVLFENGNVNKFPLSERQAGFDNTEGETFGFYIQKGLFEYVDSDCKHCS